MKIQFSRENKEETQSALKMAKIKFLSAKNQKNFENERNFSSKILEFWKHSLRSIIPESTPLAREWGCEAGAGGSACTSPSKASIHSIRVLRTMLMLKIYPSYIYIYIYIYMRNVFLVTWAHECCVTAHHCVTMATWADEGEVSERERKPTGYALIVES